MPPLYARSAATLAGATPLKPAVLSGLLLLLYIGWTVWWRRVVSPKWHVPMLAAVLIWYVVYAWRFGLGVPVFLALSALIAAMAAAERDPAFGLDIAAVVWLFDAASRFGFNWVMLAVIYLLLFIHAFRTTASSSNLATYYFVVLTAAFTFVTVSFFWFVIVTPFVALWAAEHRRVRWLCLVQLLALVLITLHTKHMLGSIWSPLHPAFFGGLPGLSDQLSAAVWSEVYWSGRQVFKLASWLMVGAAIAYLFRPDLMAGVRTRRVPSVAR